MSQPTVGNQATEAIGAMHRALNDLKSALTGLNGDIQKVLLRLHDEMRVELDKLFHHGAEPSTQTVTAPPVPQVAETSSEAHQTGVAATAEAAQVESAADGEAAQQE